MLVVAAVLAGGLAIGPTEVAVAAEAPCPDLFPSSYVADLQRRHPGVRVTAAVHDTASGCWAQINPGLSITTASVVKAQVLGAVLLRAQDQGRALTSWERSKVSGMISYSLNPETGALYDHLGGAGGVAASDRRLGASQTQHTRVFGLTRSTAADRTRVAERLLHGGGGLARAGRSVAWEAMTHVHPLQQWGITAGVPSGWTVALKNGFYPASGLGWRVGSTGFVRRDDADQGYALTVMTEGAGSQAAGIAIVEEVSRRVAAGLTVGPARSRPVDRARCTRASSGDSWTGLAARLGLPTSAWSTIRTLAGGNATPLSGQQVCSPVIPAEPRAAGSSVHGTYRPVAADLDCNGADDLVWFGHGNRPDAIWSGGSSRRFASRLLTIAGPFHPVAGDFDGDGCGDVLWYAPGTAADRIWYGGRGGVDSRAVTVDGEGFAPVAGDLDGDGHDDVLWYGAGGIPDRIWYGTGTRARFASVAVTATGAYQPVIGDLDGDGTDDVVWYRPGVGDDPIWWGSPGRRGSYRSGRAVLAGGYRPFAVDADADPARESVWYAPGLGADRLWDGAPPNHRSSALRLDGDHLPVVGDFDGDGHDDVTWYGTAGLPERIWWGQAAGGFASRSLVAG